MMFFPGKEQPEDRDYLGVKLATEQIEACFTLKEYRVKSGLSKQGLAKRMKVSVEQIARFESGSANPNMSFLRRYAKEVGAVISLVISDYDPEAVRKEFDAN